MKVTQIDAQLHLGLTRLLVQMPKIDLEAVVRPATELHSTVLFIERKPFHVNLAAILEGGERSGRGKEVGEKRNWEKQKRALFYSILDETWLLRESWSSDSLNEGKLHIKIYLDL